LSKITDLTPLDSPEDDDVLPIVDVHDETMDPAGTTKQVTVADLQAAAIAASLPQMATAAASASAALAVNTLTQVTAATPLTMTLPSPVAGALIVCERESASVASVTVSGSIRGSAGSVVLELGSESEMFLGTSSTWEPIAGHKTLGSLDARYLTATGVFPVESYGADPTGVADSTTAIQSAQTAALVSGGYVTFGPGTFRLGTITIPGATLVTSTTDFLLSGQAHFRFAGPANTILTPAAANTPLFQVASGKEVVGQRFEGGFTILAHSAGSTGPAIDLTGARQWVIEQPSYQDSARGSTGSYGAYEWMIGLGINTYACRIEDPACEGQRLGSSLIGPENPAACAANGNLIINPLIEGLVAPYALDMAGTVANTVIGGVIEGNTCSAAVVRLGARTAFRGAWFESNAGSWSYTTTGTPGTDAYFIVTTAQSATITAGDQFTDTANPGTVFTVTALGAPSGGDVSVSFTPAAGAAMSSGDVVTKVAIPFILDSAGADSQGDPMGWVLDQCVFTGAIGTLTIPAGLSAAYGAPVILGPYRSMTVADSSNTLQHLDYEAATVGPGFLWQNTAEGGTNGTTVTAGNSGGTSGTAWGTVSISGSGTALTYATAAAQTGSLGYQVTGTGNGHAQLTQSFTPRGNDLWVSFGLYIPSAYPSNSPQIFSAYTAAGSGISGLSLSSAGVLGSFTSVSASGSPSLALNTWYRVETWLHNEPANTFQVMRLYDNFGNLIATTATASAPGSFIGATGQAIIGAVGAINGTISLDNIAYSDQNWIGASFQQSAAAAYNAISPMTTPGDTEYESAAGVASRLAGNTSATKKFLTQTGTGSASAAPGWNVIAAGDLPQLPSYAPTGLTGATAPSAYCGGTTAGPPVTGTWSTGNWVADQSGAIWVCIAGGTQGTWIGIGGANAPSWLPSDSNYLAWNFDPAQIASYVAVASGAINMAKIKVPYAISVTNVVLNVGLAGSGLTSAECLAGLFTAAGAEIGLTADQHTAWATAGVLPMALTGGPYVVPAGDVYVSWVSNGGTPPKFENMSNWQATAANSGLSAAASRWATNGTGTTLPTGSSAFTMSSNVQASPTYWAALS
jgi:hypothetical protein